MLAALQGSPMANPESLKDKDKGLIYRQAGHWPKECRNHDKPPKTVCYKCHQFGGILPLGPKSLKIKCEACPHDSSAGLKCPIQVNPPVTDNHHGAGAKGAAR